VAQTEDEQQLAEAHAAIRGAHPPPWLVAVVALLVGGVAYIWVDSLPQVVRLVFAGSAALLAGAGLWTYATARARASATDRFFIRFAADRAWTYFPLTPRRLDSPLLAHGDAQRGGRGFRLPIGGHACVLYEHVRLDGEGDDRQETHYVVLVADGRLRRASGLRIRARNGFRSDAGSRMRALELESTELAQRFVVEAPIYVDERDVREVFTPTLITAFLDLADADAYLGDYLELCTDAVVLASEGTITLEDGDFVDRTVAAVAPLLDRLLGVDQAGPA
jgi:hypothetical protein